MSPSGEERFRVLFETSPVGMALAAADGTLTAVNPAVCRLWGRAEQELVGSPGLDLVYPDDRAEAAGQLRQLLAGRSGELRREQRFVRPDGSVVWADVAVLGTPPGASALEAAFTAAFGGLAPATRARHLSALRSALAWWAEAGWVAADPTAGWARPKVPVDTTRALTRAQVAAIAARLGVDRSTVSRRLAGTGVQQRLLPEPEPQAGDAVAGAEPRSGPQPAPAAGELEPSPPAEEPAAGAQREALPGAGRRADPVTLGRSVRVLRRLQAPRCRGGILVAAATNKAIPAAEKKITRAREQAAAAKAALKPILAKLPANQVNPPALRKRCWPPG